MSASIPASIHHKPFPHILRQRPPKNRCVQQVPSSQVAFCEQPRVLQTNKKRNWNMHTLMPDQCLPGARGAAFVGQPGNDTCYNTSLPTTTLQVGRYALAEVIIHRAVGSASGTVQAARICRLCRMVMHADACSFCVLDYSVSMHGQDSTHTLKTCRLRGTHSLQGHTIPVETSASMQAHPHPCMQAPLNTTPQEPP